MSAPGTKKCALCKKVYPLDEAGRLPDHGRSPRLWSALDTQEPVADDPCAGSGMTPEQARRAVMEREVVS